MKEIKDLLQEHPFFKGYPEEYLEIIAGCGQNAAFKEGDFIAKEGTPADYFYLLRRGRARIEIFQPPAQTRTIQTNSGITNLFSWSGNIPCRMHPFASHN